MTPPLRVAQVGEQFGALMLAQLNSERLLECATMRGGRFLVGGLLLSECSKTKEPVTEALSTPEARTVLEGSDDGVLQVLGPLLGKPKPKAKGKAKGGAAKAKAKAKPKAGCDTKAEAAAKEAAKAEAAAADKRAQDQAAAEQRAKRAELRMARGNDWLQ